MFTNRIILIQKEKVTFRITCRVEEEGGSFFTPVEIPWWTENTVNFAARCDDVIDWRANMGLILNYFECIWLLCVHDGQIELSEKTYPTQIRCYMFAWRFNINLALKLYYNNAEIFLMPKEHLFLERKWQKIHDVVTRSCCGKFKYFINKSSKNVTLLDNTENIG